jgi:hypothetical protein
MKLSRKQLRKMILQEMNHMGRVQDLTTARAMTSQEDNRETYVAQIAADLKDYCESEAWNCAVDYDRGMDRAEVIIGTGDDNMANNISLDIDEDGVHFEDGMTLPLTVPGGLEGMMNAVVAAIYDRMM